MALSIRDPLKTFLNWRQPGGALSLGGHALILVASIYAFNSAKPFAPATEALPVDVVSEKDFNEMMKGDKTAKEKAAEPARRVDRVAETKEDKDPGLDKKDVPAIPTKQEAKSEPLPEVKPEPEPKLAAIIPPTRPPELRVTPPLPTPPVRPEPEEELKDAEIIKQKAPPPKKEEPKKAEPQPDQLQKLLEEKQREADKALETQRKLAEDKRKLDEKLKAEAEAEKRAEEKKKADEKKKAEAEKKAKEAKAKRDREAKEAAEAEKLNNAIRQKLLASKEPAASTGSTGAVVASRATLGTSEATGRKLSPSDRAQLIGILTEQMSRCISYSGSAPKIGPQLTFVLTREGGIPSGIQLANRSGEANFVPFAEASMRALRNCQPYRIPARFLDSYEDWKNIRLNLDTSEMQ